MATKTRRIIVEVGKLKELSGIFILDKSPLDDPSSNVILGRILPQSKIFNQAAFQIEIKLPDEYPFKSPEIRFITPICHPNVSDDGKICLDSIIPPEDIKPTTPLTDFVKATIQLIDNPNLDHALNPEIAAEYVQNRSTFDRKALDMVKKHGLPRQ